MYDFVKYLQEKLDVISPGSYLVSSERNIDSKLEKIEVVVSMMSTTINDSRATDIPYELQIVTTNIDKVRSDFLVLAKTYSGVSFTQISEGETCVITPFFNTPTVLEQDVQNGSQHYAKIVVFSSVNEKTGINNIKSLTINDEKIELLSGTFGYSAEVNSTRVSGEEIVKSKRKAASCALTFMCLNKNSPFFNQAFKISIGALSGDTSFSCEIELDNGLSATLDLFIVNYTLSVERAKLPSVNITMYPYNPLGD